MIKIKHIKIENNPILWNVDLDFTKDDGSIYETILFVGENGSGKSTLMDIIYQFTKLEEQHLEENERRELTIEIFQSEEQNIQNWIYTISFDSNDLNDVWTGEYFMRHYKVVYQDEDFSRYVLSSYRDQYKRFMKSIFSDVAINFQSKVISATGKTLDAEVSNSIKSDEKIAQEITQILVDIKVADNADLDDRVAANERSVPPSNIRNKRINRFKVAFDSMFSDSGLEYKNIKGVTPTFEKNGQIIEINNLSSWEKQIVFRGWFLLKDKESIMWALALVDEPEISMHPRWQKKALDFYKNLFRDWSWNQTSQLIITTHSPYVLQTYDPNKDCIVVFSSEEKKRIEAMRAYIWTIPSLWVINWYAFKLPTVEFFDELYEYIQTKSGNKSQKQLETYLEQHWIPVDQEYKNRGQTQYCTLRTFIRNKIHHAAVYEWEYSEVDLISSIENMINFISMRRLWLPQFPLAIPSSLSSLQLRKV